MRKYISLVSMLILACFFTACDIPQDDPSLRATDNGGGERTFDYGPRNFPEDCPLVHISGTSVTIPLVIMDVELVNNTGSEINVFNAGGLHIGPGYEPDRQVYGIADAFQRRGVRHAAEGYTTSVFNFTWSPHDRLWSVGGKGSYTSVCPECGFLIAPGDEFKERFRPYMKSFFLEIHVDGEPFYLAGWPQSFASFSAGNLDWFYRNEQNRFTRMEEGKFDRSRIVQYGIGFSDNTEVFVDEGGYPAHHYTIEYVDDEGRAAVYNADVPYLSRDGRREWAQPNWIKGKAVITVDAPYKITYKTVSFEVVHTLN